MRKLQLFFKSLFSSKQMENEGVLKEEDSPVPASTPKEVRSELERDMEEFNHRKSTKFVGWGPVQVQDFKDKFNKKYAEKGLSLLLIRLEESRKASNIDDAKKIINEAIDEVNENYPLEWSINSGITTSNANQTIITLNSHKLIIDKDGAFRIIDIKNQNKLILSKQSAV